jgi:hypothetical protein
MPALHIVNQASGGGFAHARRSAQGARHILAGFALGQQSIGELSPRQVKSAGRQSVRLICQAV